MQPTNTQNPNNPNQYNLQTGNLVLNNSTTGIGQTPPVIPAGVGLGSVPTQTLPGIPTGTGASGLSGSAAGYLAMPALQGTQNFGSQLTSANNVANQNAQQGQQDYQSQVLGLINQMQNRPGELEQQYGIQQLSADALKAKANYDSVELAYRRQKEAAQVDGSISREQKAATIGEIERKEASQKADIAIDYNLKAGLLSNAKELMQKQIALELEPMKLKVDYYKDNRDRFDKILDKTEMRQYDYVQKKEERAYQAAQKAADRKANLIEKAIDNGVYSADMKGMSYDQLAEKIGTAQAETGNFASTIDTAVSFEPATLQKSTKQQLGQLIAKGDYKGVQTRIANAVSKGLTGENKTNFDSKRNALPAIEELTSKLQAYADAGGDMGILKGKSEDVAAKLGQVKDPAFKALATDLKISLQAYRQNVSGAAFSPQEAKEYASVNPTGNKSLNLNISILDGMKSNFQRQVNGTIDTMVGEGAKNIREYSSYQGLPKEDALVKYYTENPQKQQIIDELRKVPGITVDDIAVSVGITNLIK